MLRTNFAALAPQDRLCILFYDAAVALRVPRRMTFTSGDEVVGILAEADWHGPV